VEGLGKLGFWALYLHMQVKMRIFEGNERTFVYALGPL
jgi:hypothetical protein